MGSDTSRRCVRMKVRRAFTKGTHLLEPVAVGSDEFEDTAAEFARSVQIVSRLPGNPGFEPGASRSRTLGGTVQRDRFRGF